MSSRGKKLVNLALQSKENMNGLKPSQVDDNNSKTSDHQVLNSSSSNSSSTSNSSSESSDTLCSDIDTDDSVADKDYVPDKEDETDETEDESLPRNQSLCPDKSKASQESVSILVSPAKKGIKRKRRPETWKRIKQKQLRNAGKAYTMHTKEKTMWTERRMKPPCGEKRRLNCSSKIDEEARMEIFNSYWDLGELSLLRQFIANSITAIEPTYRYVRIGRSRQPRALNSAFNFHVNGEKVRVCKLFFKNTLDINDRPIRTVLEKQKKIAGTLLEPDLRGKHDYHATVSQEIRDGIKQHVNSIPKIESHGTQANTSKSFIDGSKSIADIHKDYVAKCKEQKQFGNYTLFYRIFTEEYNISFHTPKKDQCDVCTAFENATETEKYDMKESYDLHHREMELSRTEKVRDKEKKDCAVAVYDLQAVIQLPKGEVLAFYYKSKLNVLNFTIYNLISNACNCYIWNESNGHRGVNELGTCVLKYLKDTCDSGCTDFIFYSDNCSGQQKNKLMLALCLYAVTNLDIHSITHKYLIKGPIQNEGDRRIR
ncbi:uncharacterized protein [Palaemon carinicauda]|uniref:uncharacterized protein n=1 Tax=Palaemon carinicauda TaxID=392227 RepID=UPI0035B57B08